VTVVTRNPVSFVLTALLFLTGASGVPAQTLAASLPGDRHPAEELFLRLGEVGLHPERVYHVRDAHIDRPGLYLTLEDGTVGFTEDVEGRVTGALFSGEGEILVLPPDRAERSSLALFTGSAILEEKFTFGYFRFNDGTFHDLEPLLKKEEDATAFLSKWGTTAHELAAGDALRLLITYSTLLPPAAPSGGEVPQSRGVDRMLHARLGGAKLGAFDVIYDSAAAEPVQILQSAHNQETSYYDIWMSFAPKQSHKVEEAKDSFAVSSYRIQARVTPPSSLEAEANCVVEVRGEGQRTLLFELSRYLKVRRVEADGVPLEFIHNPAVDGSQLARQGNDLVAVVFPRTLKSGQRIAMKFAYDGDVLSEEANGLLSVGARGTWYPNRGLRMADFDLSFSYPSGWTLLATGKRSNSDEALSGDATASVRGEMHSRWISTRPIPVAGFNLGRYVKAVAKAGNVTVEAYATQELGLAAPKKTAAVPGKDLPTSSPPIPQFFSPSSPAKTVQAVANRAADAVSFFADRFGEFPYSSLALTQAPGPLSQGWPGLVFLSGYAFLSGDELAAHQLSPAGTVLAQLTPAHETAHQWWGDLVMYESYRDQWISEGLASYSALLELEEKDPAAFRLVLDGYRDDLLQEKDGRRMRDAGAVTLGQRLNSSHFPHGYEVIAYGRGAWLFHMLRQMLREQAAAEPPGSGAKSEETFTQILRGVQEKYAGKSLSTRELLQEFETRWPKSLWFEGKPSLDWFWDGWIQGTSVPTLELKGVKFLHQKQELWAVGTIVQGDAPEDLVTPVPLYADMKGKPPLFLGRMFADGRETVFRFRVPAGTKAIALDPHETLLRHR